MFRIYDGRKEFWQWDLERRLVVEGDCNEVHFCNGCDNAPVLEVFEEDGLRLVNVPNDMLTKAGTLTAYAYIKEEDGSYTERREQFTVKQRCKPSDYVYSETEVKSYETLEKRITALEGGVVQADFAQNDETALDYVKNKTHYDTRKIERVNYTFDGNIEGKETLTVSDDGTRYLVKISDDVPLSSDLIGGTMSAYSTGTEISELVSKDVISYPIDTLYVVGETLFVALGDTDLDGITLTKGMWIIYALSDGVPVYYGTSLSYSKVVSGELKKLEEKYIPDATNEAISTAQATAETAKRTANNKMNITNPVGTGSFSLNRKSGTIVGAYSHAEGSEATASGAYSHAEGRDTYVGSDSTKTVSRIANTAAGFCGHAEGYGTISYGRCSHAEGNGTMASGYDSHAEGYNTTASGEGSHAEGWSTTASSRYSHAEGWSTNAKGSSAHAEGYKTTAETNGHAEGEETYASTWAHAEGYKTFASSIHQHAQGKYNIKDPLSTYAHIVGNGTSDSARSNAHTLDWNGVGWFQGGLQVGGNSQDDGAKNVLLEGDAIPVPTSAEVGQVVSVKAVDDEGKPTEWECVDNEWKKLDTITMEEDIDSIEIDIPSAKEVYVICNFRLNDADNSITAYNSHPVNIAVNGYISGMVLGLVREYTIHPFIVYVEKLSSFTRMIKTPAFSNGIHFNASQNMELAGWTSSASDDSKTINSVKIGIDSYNNTNGYIIKTGSSLEVWYR